MADTKRPQELEGPFCAHTRISYRPIKVGSGMIHAKWTCDDCDFPFIPCLPAPIPEPQEEALPPLDFGLHNATVCECDLEGGDSDCELQPLYRSSIQQREHQLRASLAHNRALQEQFDSFVAMVGKLGVVQSTLATAPTPREKLAAIFDAARDEFAEGAAATMDEVFPPEDGQP